LTPPYGAPAISPAALLAQATEALSVAYYYPILIFAVCMLIWDTVEVGRNDAANLVNAVYGSRLMTRRRAVFLAGLAVIAGATLGEGVIETARKGIFDPKVLQIEEAVAIYVSVYLVDTVLLYGYSAFGMPVSTTACLVFELLGASLMMSLIRSYDDVVQWPMASKVVSAIIISIFLSGSFAYLIQRVVRGAIGRDTEDLQRMKLHGTWIGGGMATGMFFFLILKGMKNVPWITWLRDQIGRLDVWLAGLAGMATPSPESNVSMFLGMLLVLVFLWLISGAVILALLKVYREKVARQLFPVLAIAGMLAMSVAFGQNDLANCASPGLATVQLLDKADEGIQAATKAPIPRWMLFGCGIMLFLGMRTKNATRVTKAEVNMGSHSDRVSLYAPRWCIAIGQTITMRRPRDVSLAPEPLINTRGKRMHYDPLRACTIMGVSASVIALASSYKLPVSTTYVTFAAVVGSGIGDRIFQRGDAALKMARAIWVVFSWFLAAVIAAAFTGGVCMVVYYLGIVGLVGMLAVNLYLRSWFKKRGDIQSKKTRQEMMERAFPERYAEEDV